MKYSMFALALLLSSMTHAADKAYCHDLEAQQEWHDIAREHLGSDSWQRLHALWLGLCQKVDAGGITHNRAIRIFEEERAQMIRLEKRKLDQPVNPFG